MFQHIWWRLYRTVTNIYLRQRTLEMWHRQIEICDTYSVELFTKKSQEKYTLGVVGEIIIRVGIKEHSRETTYFFFFTNTARKRKKITTEMETATDACAEFYYSKSIKKSHKYKHIFTCYKRLEEKKPV